METAEREIARDRVEGGRIMWLALYSSASTYRPPNRGIKLKSFEHLLIFLIKNL